MNILIFNCGSSSLTCKVFATETGKPIREILAVKAHRVGVTGVRAGFIEYKCEGRSEKDLRPALSHQLSAKRIADYIKKKGIALDYLGHRFVHGGNLFRNTAWIDKSTLNKLQNCLSLAPIHNPISLSVILECSESLPGIPQYITFDNAFHLTIPPRAYTYALPRSIIRRYGFRRFGFHGLSYLYTARIVSDYLEVPAEELNMVVCHLGTGGASVAAVRGGKSIDTSMGYSPLPGLIMSTRCGDIDPMTTIYLMAVYGYQIDQLENILNKQSGLLGVSGFSSDIRDLIANLSGPEGDQARLALKMYIHRIRKYIGSYALVLGRTDVLAFTDDIGINNPVVREKICEEMEWLGVKLDPRLNQLPPRDNISVVSQSDSGVRVMTVKPEEELVICWEGLKLLRGES
jgi:acetate kinase